MFSASFCKFRPKLEMVEAITQMTTAMTHCQPIRMNVGALRWAGGAVGSAVGRARGRAAANRHVRVSHSNAPDVPVRSGGGWRGVTRQGPKTLAKTFPANRERSRLVSCAGPTPAPPFPGVLFLVAVPHSCNFARIVSPPRAPACPLPQVSSMDDKLLLGIEVCYGDTLAPQGYRRLLDEKGLSLNVNGSGSLATSLWCKFSRGPTTLRSGECVMACRAWRCAPASPAPPPC